jgi:hypothetical protein
VKKSVKRFCLLASGAIGGFALAVALLVANRSEPEKQSAEVDPYLELEATFQRLPEHEALLAEILGLASLKSNIRVYLDTYNPSLCGRADAKLRTIILSEPCSKPLRVKGGYHWRNVGILAHEIGHILNGHGTEPGLAPSPDTPKWQQDEADAFARWAMEALGATSDEIEKSVPQDGIAPNA